MSEQDYCDNDETAEFLNREPAEAPAPSQPTAANCNLCMRPMNSTEAHGEGKCWFGIPQCPQPAQPVASPKRACLDCGAEITACNGHVLADQLVKAVAGEITFTQVQERCPKCELKRSLSVAAPSVEELDVEDLCEKLRKELRIGCWCERGEAEDEVIFCHNCLFMRSNIEAAIREYSAAQSEREKRAKEILYKELDRVRDGESLISLCCIAANGLYWRSEEIKKLSEAREKAEARVRELEQERKNLDGDLLYSRNKWHMLCEKLGREPAATCVADIHDEWERRTKQLLEADALAPSLRELLTHDPGCVLGGHISEQHYVPDPKCCAYCRAAALLTRLSTESEKE